MEREAHDFGRELIQRLAVNHDLHFLSDHLSPQMRLDYPPSQQEYIISRFTELGVPNQPIQVDENISFQSHFFRHEVISRPICSTRLSQ